MTFLIVGIVGVVVAGFVSKSFYTRAAVAGELKHDKPFGAAVPKWVSLFYLVAFGCALYGLYKITF